MSRGHLPLVYLAGAIEFAVDAGRGWREQITPFLRDRLGHEVYDPARDERKSLDDEECRNLRAWKTTDLPRFRAAVRKIIEFDLGIIARSDYVVCYLDESGLRGGGTAAEMTFAFRRGIPVYLVTELPLAEVSGWMLGCSARVFSGFEPLREFLRDVYLGSGGRCSPDDA
jgi:nucleoside 2-deoxyribosyltransferase